MSGRHSAIPRGLEAARSPLYQGRFGRMFRNLRPAVFGKTDAETAINLANLAKVMSGDDVPTDGADPEESGIPALYTYFGQFIDHDITFDPVSSLTKTNDPDGLTDFRTPALDMDNLYGRGPDDQPYMYDSDGRHLALGDVLTGGGDPGAHDLPRFRGRALIGDPRNDENSIVSQLQGLFQRFHNRMCDDNPDLSFDEIQQLVRFHYQYVVINDFLPRIIKSNVLEELKIDGVYNQKALKFYHWREYPFMPVEFSVAAYRLGHSMVRPGYRLNDEDAMLLPIFPTSANPVGLTGFQTMAAGRGIDWARFIDIETRAYGGEDASDADKKRRLQFAYRIDTSFVGPLSNLPPTVATPPPASLGERNLVRGWRLQLPSGQAVARAMGLTPMEDKHILIGKAVDADQVDPADPKVVDIVTAAGPAFAGNCPLWAYVLAEAAHHRIAIQAPVQGDIKINTPQLGPVGGRIVAEVFLGMLFGDGASLLARHPAWIPASGPDFKLKDIILYALDKGPALIYQPAAAGLATPPLPSPKPEAAPRKAAHASTGP